MQQGTRVQQGHACSRSRCDGGSWDHGVDIQGKRGGRENNGQRGAEPAAGALAVTAVAAVAMTVVVIGQWMAGMAMPVGKGSCSADEVAETRK